MAGIKEKAIKVVATTEALILAGSAAYNLDAPNFGVGVARTLVTDLGVNFSMFEGGRALVREVKKAGAESSQGMGAEPTNPDNPRMNLVFSAGGRNFRASGEVFNPQRVGLIKPLSPGK